MAKTREKAEFGDFQTPNELASQVCQLLNSLGCNPAAVVEPTCGKGNLLFAALSEFPNIEQAIGLDISADYVSAAQSRIKHSNPEIDIKVSQGSFFNTDWNSIIEALPSPLLVIGNPPWVTNSELGTLKSSNLPEKSNFQNHSGFDAMTGKSNFDISEWILIQILHWLNSKDATLAMLCKTAVARKTLSYAWKNKITVSNSAIYHIDALSHFEASVDACLLICQFNPFAQNFDTPIFTSLEANKPDKVIGYRDNEIVASVKNYDLCKHLRGNEKNKWRSGIKHDCSRVMELTKEGEFYRNGFGELVSLEDEFLFPMMKSSEIANSNNIIPKRWMLVTQKSVQEDTKQIEKLAPKTWEYLHSKGDLLDKRGSSIYKKRARFSVFGIGDYSFSKWKVAISGFYKKLNFKVLGSYEGKPIVLDDTCYFIPCDTKQEAEYIAFLLNSTEAKAFFESFVFWDSKRPITIDLLRRLDLLRLEKELDTQPYLQNSTTGNNSLPVQSTLF